MKGWRFVFSLFDDYDMPVIMMPIMMMIMNQVKDVRVPAQLMRAMAAESEAAREARAKVVLFMTIKIRGFESTTHFQSRIEKLPITVSQCPPVLPKRSPDDMNPV